MDDQELIKAFKPASNKEPEIEELSEEELLRFRHAGIELNTEKKSGSFIQINQEVKHCSAIPEGVELLPIKEALKKYNGLEDYWWKAIKKDKDVFTKEADQGLDNGYFIRIKKGAVVNYPIQSCLYIRDEGVSQKVHNIVIVEEGAKANIITGCTTHPHLKSGLHIGVSEFFVEKNAYLIFTMIHNWAEDVYVRPRTGIILKERAVFVSNYISLKGVKSVQTFPTAYLNGEGAMASFNSVVVAPKGSSLDLGSRVVLNAPKSKAEIISRTISYGGSVYARGHLIGKAKDIKAHLECQGLMLSKTGVIRAIPELEAHVPDVDMSHEAAVGRIAQEEIEYLMARGLSDEEAISTIVRGFLNVKIEGLPPELDDEIQEVVKECQKGM